MWESYPQRQAEALSTFFEWGDYSVVFAAIIFLVIVIAYVFYVSKQESEKGIY